MAGPLLGGIQHCKRCATEYDGHRRACPHCEFNPKQRGIRVAMGCFLVVVLAMSAAWLSFFVYPGAGVYLVAVAAVGFVSTLVLMVLAYFATPYRLGRLFLYF